MKHYLFIILLQVCCYSCAQQKVSINQLIGTKWSIESPQDVKRTVEFHKDYYSKIISVSFPGYEDTSTLDYEYYLSNEIPNIFEKKRNKKKGIYIVSRNRSNKRMYYYTIMSFSEKKMVLFKKKEELKEGHIVIGEAPKDITLTLERIYE